ncbi:MAG: glycerol-3-phosphate 1-O-acyltransferase PlsY [Ruminococcus sp.]|nr:glycerol-3-phosphate 1-O-acyltransferase PlsY [Ruminococcus sp.]
MIGKLILCIIIAAAIGYLMGSINSSIMVVRLLKHEDVRKFGSGNAGLTNTLRCFGKLCALLTLIGDLGKGVVAVLLSRDLIAQGIMGSEYDVYFIGYVAGMTAILGHVFPLYYGFKGGKGVLVGVSVFLVLDWRVFCILIGIFALILICSKYVSLSSIIATACAPFVTVISQYVRWDGYDLWRLALHFGLTAVMAATIIWMHRSNIERLRNGTENKFGSKKPKTQA